MGNRCILGGGGMNGSVITGLGNVPGTPTVTTEIPTPLTRGYVTFGSDSGHTSVGFDGTFALNDESFYNFAGDQLRKTLDTAQALIKLVYGRIPDRQYFAEGSQGGHEAFTVAQRWPEKYDGIIAYYPVVNYTGAILHELAQQKALFGTPGGWLNANKRALIRNAALAACDNLDGLIDNIIGHPSACTFSVTLLRCPTGADEGDACLSDTQIATVNVMSSRQTFGFSLNAGVNDFPGWPILLGADTSPMTGSSDNLADSILGAAGTSFVRYFVTKNATEDVLLHDPNKVAGKWVDVANAMDSLTVDMSGFKNRGGKVLWLHGTTDYLYPHGSSTDYWTRLTSAYGDTALRSFMRFYLVPGYGHGSGTFNVSWDSLPVLEQWVEAGVSPGVNTMTIEDANATTRGRTRPLCDYPARPQYKGAGDANLASSYECVL